MKKSILLVGGICIFLMSLAPSSFASHFIYPVPPPNDTSLNNTVQPHYHAARHSYRHHHHRRHRHYYTCKAPRHAHHPTTGLFLYYALPATACCGETWQLRKTRCCAQPGVWSSSPYATFKPAPTDFIYSETNDDDTRPYDLYWDVTGDDSIEDPD